ncbi:MAG: hypothetical protein NC910_04535 [Candidatus Omnitrophica bacterium]|nr:hypothetical protein [Candidatus Omnitrophota bacterium]
MKADKKEWVAVLTVFFMTMSAVPAFAALLIDDFETSGNKIGGRSNTYVQEPSRALALRVKEQAYSGSGSLMIKYDKKAKGGPYDSGGWCGYYTLLKTSSKYFDATPYQVITFWVKGETGSENFVIGVSDRHWDEVGDSVKSEAIGSYLPAGKLTTEWQKATIPLSVFLVDLKELASLAVCFEGSVLPGGAGRGTVYVDDLQFE